jgi:N-acetylmuramoyl-L-alanine amidase
MKKKHLILALVGVTLLGLSGCGQQPTVETQISQVAEESQVVLTTQPEETPAVTETVDITSVPEETPSPTPAVTETVPAETEEAETENGYVICIDAGHQAQANSGKEPLGPGSSETKTKVSSGTQGSYTGIPEYQLNLDVALLLQTELESRGYTVIMCRTTSDVDLSNADRATIANEAGAAAFLRIHADGSDSSASQGCMTICMTSSNPYNADIYQESYTLSSLIVEHMEDTMGCVSRGVWQTDTMSGINWSQVPVTIIEMGFMTNEEEDNLMASDDYRAKIVQGIADGLDAYFEVYP